MYAASEHLAVAGIKYWFWNHVPTVLSVSTLHIGDRINAWNRGSVGVGRVCGLFCDGGLLLHLRMDQRER